jgi:hypothetical protein
VPKLVIYVIGLVPLGLGQYWLRRALGDIAAFAIAIAYLIALRLIAEKWGAAKSR